MSRTCHHPLGPEWPEETFAGLAARASHAASAYAEAFQVRRTRLEAMYAAKVEHARAKAAYRQARRAYHTACRSAQAAKTSLGDAHRACENAVRDAYIDWCARHRQAQHGDRLLAVRELARIQGVAVAQMARLLGYRAERTSAEVAEDLHRYLGGTPVLVIASERGISRQAVYDRIRRYKVEATPSAPLAPPKACP